MTTSTVGARLDRLPVGPFHYGVFWLVGAGMSSTVVEMVLAAQERDHLGSRSSPASAGSPGSSSCSPKTIIETEDQRRDDDGDAALIRPGATASPQGEALDPYEPVGDGGEAA